MFGAARFCFLNEIHDLCNSGWDDVSLDKLWRYNLHYFDDLNAQGAIDRETWHRALLTQWVRENPPGPGTAWEPYPISVRIVNWFKWALAGNELPLECVQSLAMQVRWLSRRLEIHLLGNHLFTNAKALVFAGLFFEGVEADTWLERGLEILACEIDKQILVDGGQFERSSMYHALALEDMLDLVNLTTKFADSLPRHWRSAVLDWRKRIPVMLEWMKAMCHPDGEIGFFNDAATGVAPTLIDLESYVARLDIPKPAIPFQAFTHLAASGYIRIEQDNVVALLDVAPIGPDYLPGHAHADTLSFELSLFGQRALVNSGTSCYGNSVERLRQRGTAAHNTVVINGENSSEVWKGFRVARRAHPRHLEIENKEALVVRCSHDGYCRLQGKPVHTRQWSFGPNSLLVEDRISGNYARAEARFHLHPSITINNKQVESNGTNRVTLRTPYGQSVIFRVDSVLRAEDSTWHPEFGRSEPNLCLVVDLKASVIRTHIQWFEAA